VFVSHIWCKPRSKVSRLTIKTYGTHAPNINKYTFTSTEVKHYAVLEVTYGKAPTFSGIRRLIHHYCASNNNFYSADSELKSRSPDRTSLGFCTSNYSLQKISDNYPYKESTINSKPTYYTTRSHSSILSQVSLNQILNRLNIKYHVEVCALLEYYTACGGNSLPMFRDNLLVPSSRFKKTKKMLNF
jgi:hypothetical protein